ncbi:MAG TPA: NfeD family protein [Solirubrobacteraceae bacterium]|nr:NfeD family protein [Solirubrobacteraceae bacterium]
MTGWVWWLLVACGFGVGELTLTAGFWLAPFALGAGLASGADAVGGGAPVDFAVFVVVTLVALVSLRPLVASRLLHSTPLLRTGAAALIGQHAVVLERIANREGVGTVRIGAEIWSARAYDDLSEIAVGTEVEVVDIRGATALVME